MHLHCLCMSCNYWSLVFIVCDCGNADQIENPVSRNLKKKLFCVIEIVPGQWRAGVDMQWNLVIRAQEPHTSTAVTTVWESLLKPHLVLLLCVRPHLFELIAYYVLCGFKCSGHIEGIILWWAGMMWATGSVVPLCHHSQIMKLSLWLMWLSVASYFLGLIVYFPSVTI